MLKFLFGKRESKDAQKPEEPRRSLFSTHANDDPVESKKINGQKVLNAFIERLERDRPVPEINGAMDGAEYGDSAISVKAYGSMASAPINEYLLMWYVSQSFIGHQMAAIIAQHWLINKACLMPARDAIRQGYTLTGGDGEDLDAALLKKISNLDKKFGLKRNMLEWLHMGRVFGVRIAFFKVDSDDPDYYEKPFNIDGIKKNSYKGIVQVDPYWTAPQIDGASSSDPSSMYFYEPTWWLINGKRYHRSHLIIFRNSHLADILKPSYLYGGVPVPQQIMERVYAAERTANEGPQLAMSKRTTVFSTNLAQAFANKDKFDERMSEWVAYRDNQQIKIADKEADLVQQFDTSLADLDSVIMTQYQIVAAAAGVPATKLLGTTPKGFNATGEYEESSYHEELESLQEHDLTPFAERHHQLLAKSYLGDGVVIQLNWNPLDSPTALEYSTINLNNAQAGAALINVGAIDGMDEQERLINDKNSGYAGLKKHDIEMPEDDEEQWQN